jgi:hypothetical protein
MEPDLARVIDLMTRKTLWRAAGMTSDLGGYYGKHRRADAQTSSDSAGSSDTAHHRTESLIITGDKTRDAALGEARIRAGEIIGWRYWRLRDGLLESVFVPYTWRPGVFERASSKHPGPYNMGYHAFKDIEQAQREAFLFNYCRASVIGSVAMWGEVIEHAYGWRSEYAAVRSIIKISGGIRFLTKRPSLQELRERYDCQQ